MINKEKTEWKALKPENFKASESTRARIERCAVKEFLEKGFNGASLRKIVKDAGVTTGAFYKYYPTKEALFEGLAGPAAKHIYQMFDDSYREYVKQDLSGQIRNMNDNSETLTEQVVDYAFQHLDAMKLLLTASEGTQYSDFIHQLAGREARSSVVFAKQLRESGLDIPEIDGKFAHMVASGFFSAVFEIILHNMEKENAIRRVKMLEKFYTAGWEKIFGITFGED